MRKGSLANLQKVAIVCSRKDALTRHERAMPTSCTRRQPKRDGRGSGGAATHQRAKIDRPKRSTTTKITTRTGDRDAARRSSSIASEDGALSSAGASVFAESSASTVNTLPPAPEETSSVEPEPMPTDPMIDVSISGRSNHGSGTGLLPLPPAPVISALLVS